MYNIKFKVFIYKTFQLFYVYVYFEKKVFLRYFKLDYIFESDMS